MYFASGTAITVQNTPGNTEILGDTTLLTDGKVYHGLLSNRCNYTYQVENALPKVLCIGAALNTLVTRHVTEDRSPGSTPRRVGVPIAMGLAVVLVPVLGFAAAGVVMALFGVRRRS